MSFQQGLSGLNVASSALNAVGNNIANSGTVGFKSATAQFSDVYAASLSGAGASQVGIGAALSTVAQQFTQGGITTTNNPLDLAINGGGFYRLSDNGAISYSRAGQFQVDKSGFVVNAAGLHLQGYSAVYTTDPSGIIVQSTPSDIFIDPSDLAPKTTSAITVGLNLDSRQAVPNAVAHPFSISDPLSYNSSTSLTTYDSLGNPHTTTMYFVKNAGTAGTNPTAPVGATSQWDMYTSVDGTAVTNVSAGGGAAGAAYNLYFDNTGKYLPSSATLPSLSVNLAAVGTAPGAASPLVSTFNFNSSTQFGSSFGVNNLVQNGFTSGHLTGISVSGDGVIQGNYSNGQSKKMGQVVLAKFNNPNGLQNQGGNRWAETATSGLAIIGAPGSGANGVVQSGAVEESNVDLTAELVNMITQQRAYQANAQTIKTEDQVLQTLVNLR